MEKDKKQNVRLCEAAYNGCVAEVRELIALADPSWRKSTALIWAAQNGHTECVRLLLPFSNPKDQDSMALRMSVMNGHTTVLSVLLPVSDPKARNSAALLYAVCYEHEACMDMLWEVSDVDAVLECAHTSINPASNLWPKVWQRRQAERQQNMLHISVRGDSAIVEKSNTPPRKI